MWGILNMKTKIIALGGGYPRAPSEDMDSFRTPEIDDYVVASARELGVNKPQVLFVGTAAEDSDFYQSNVEYVHAHYGDKGCDILVLELKGHDPADVKFRQELNNRINTANIIHVSGGDPVIMMNRWKLFKMDSTLRARYQNDEPVILTGISAGAECWFPYGITDNYAELACLGIVGGKDLLVCPHYDQKFPWEKLSVRESTQPMLRKRTGKVSLAIDDCCAIEVVQDKNGNDQYRILGYKAGAEARLVGYRGEKYVQSVVPKNQFFSLGELISHWR